MTLTQLFSETRSRQTVAAAFAGIISILCVSSIAAAEDVSVNAVALHHYATGETAFFRGQFSENDCLEAYNGTKTYTLRGTAAGTQGSLFTYEITPQAYGIDNCFLRTNTIRAGGYFRGFVTITRSGQIAERFKISGRYNGGSFGVLFNEDPNRPFAIPSDLRLGFAFGG